MRRALKIDDRVLWLVVVAWLAMAACALWFFELRFERPLVSKAHATLFESGAAAPEAEEWFRRRLAAVVDEDATPIATVVHVYDASCPCNRFTEPHLARIQAIYRSQRVRFIRVESSSALAAGSPEWIEASPAALVFDAHGKLIFFGPYSEAAACGTANGLVERVLNQVLSGKDPVPQLVISGGCFCAHTSRAIFGIKL